MSSIKQAELLFREFMQAVGLNPDDPHMRETPIRFTKMLCEQTANYRKEPSFTTKTNYNTSKEIKATVFDSEGTDQLVIVKDIEITSICAHHFAPFIGHAHIGYLPNRKIIGLSKLARIADFYAKRPQTQELLTTQIAECLMNVTEAKFVGVIISAKHTCMSCRGVRKVSAETITSKFMPSSQDTTKAEFLRLVL